MESNGIYNLQWDLLYQLYYGSMVLRNAAGRIRLVKARLVGRPDVFTRRVI